MSTAKPSAAVTQVEFKPTRKPKPINVDWTDREAAASHHLRTVVRLAWLVRDAGPYEIQSYLSHRLPKDRQGLTRELRALVVIAATLVDDTRTPSELLAWHSHFGTTDVEWSHRRYEGYRADNVSLEEIPYGVVKGEQAYQERLRRKAAA